MKTTSYPSDITDAQWALIEPHLPVYPGGRPRTTSLRAVVNAIFYILRTECQWRYLPRDFPPKSTVWRYFDEGRHNGTLELIHDALRRKVRIAENPIRLERRAALTASRSTPPAEVKNEDATTPRMSTAGSATLLSTAWD
jgi:transposase